MSDSESNQMPAVAAAQLPALAVELQEARELIEVIMTQLDELRHENETIHGKIGILRAAHDDQAARIGKLLDQIRTEHASDRERQTADRAQLAQLTAELEGWRRLPWYKRIFGRR